METTIVRLADVDTFYQQALQLLQLLITTPSFSRDETRTADILEQFFYEQGIIPSRKLNNLWMWNRHFKPDKPTILLNSHHDTVRPNSGYTRHPFDAVIEEGKLYGLGSNDAGGCLVALIAVFLYFYDKEDLKYNFCLATTAEEEISGYNGLQLIIPELGELDFGIIGEPTQMNLAVAEKGLMVLDCVAHGKAGHAARDESDNALYKALTDIEWFRTYKFPKESEIFGPVKMSVTVINAGSQHNVVPYECSFVVDVRVTDIYTNDEVLSIIRENISCDVTRTVNLKSSFIDLNHPIVKAGISMGKIAYGSPTTSDQSLLDIQSVKIGPGDSARSHTADEFIYIDEIRQGIEQYIAMLEKIV